MATCLFKVLPGGKNAYCFQNSINLEDKSSDELVKH